MAVPGPPGLLHALLVLTFIFHVLLLNVALGGTTLGAFYCIKGPRGPGRRLAHDMARWNVHGIGFTAVTGLVPLLFLLAIYGRFYLDAVTLLGGLWILVLAVFALGSSTTFIQRFTDSGAVRPWMSIAAVCFIAAGAVFTVVNVLALRLDLWPEVERGGGAVLRAPSLLPRFLHFFVGALAFTAFLLMLHQVHRPSGPDETEEDRDYRRWAATVGLRWARWMTAVELAIGVWFLVALPEKVLLGVMGESPYALVVLLVGVLLAMVLIVSLYGIQNPLQEKKRTSVASLAFLLVIIFMVLLRDAVRGVYLTGLFDPADLLVESQWVIVGLYIMFLVLTLGSLSLSIRSVRRS